MITLEVYIETEKITIITNLQKDIWESQLSISVDMEIQFVDVYIYTYRSIVYRYIDIDRQVKADRCGLGT